ncbi:MAG TPA: hypothetical protein ENH82_04655 [bacterium]|nr:hypothetical protein [bacterium]
MATLQRIRNSTRNITGRKSINQLSQDRLDDFINDFYLYDFPERLKTLQLEGWFRFNTVPNVSRYPLFGSFSSGRPSPTSQGGIGVDTIQEKTLRLDDIYSINKPAYMDGYEISFIQDSEVFYRYWPDLKFIEQAATGNGTDNYLFTLTQLPAQAGSVIISADKQSTRDDGDVNNTGTGGWIEAGYAGTVNYTSGDVDITFPNAVDQGVVINAHYYPYVASRPRDVLFYEQYFEFRPIPDRAYEFRVHTQRRPTAMVDDDDPPEFVEWCNLISYGAALKIFIEDGDWDEYRNLYPIFQEQKNLAQRRALKQLRDERVETPYDGFNASQTSFWPIYPLF